MSDNQMQAKNGGSNMWLAIGLVALVVVAGGYLFMQMNKQTGAPVDVGNKTEQNITVGITGAMETTPAESITVGKDAMVKEGKTVTVEMEAGSFYFKPNKITVKKGDNVKVVLTAKDMMHNFYLDEFQVKGPSVKSGETSTVEFTANKAGSFEFYCNVGQHRKNGQVGSLVVE